MLSKNILFSLLLCRELILVQGAPASNADPHRRFQRLQARYQRKIRQKLADREPDAACNIDNVHIRKQWGDISERDRSSYIEAVMCLYDAPSQSDPLLVPGARNRFDDFVASHIVEAPFAHYNGHFYAWHRHFTWLYDEALRNECGYKGPFPYWDWTLSHDDPAQNPVFDGSDFSLGGNGKPVPHGDTYAQAFGKSLVAPAGTGGGCLEDGHPFADITVNLGLNMTISEKLNTTVPQLKKPKRKLMSGKARIASPLAMNASGPAFPDPYGDHISQSLEYNPRCLTRDLNPGWGALTTTRSLNYLLECTDLVCLERRSNGWEAGVSNYTNSVNQLHNAGHLTIGGLNNNQYASAGDPAFFLLHGQIDRIWSLWQGQDLESRTYEIGGTYMPYDNPETSEVQPDDVLDFPFVGDSMELEKIGSTIDGPYCFMYE